jgi:hypothetical protein
MIGTIQKIKLGNYSADYMVVGVDNFLLKEIRLKIVKLPKTKIGCIRTPETITIPYLN